MRPGLDPHAHALTYHVASQVRTVGEGGLESERKGQREGEWDGPWEGEQEGC